MWTPFDTSTPRLPANTPAESDLTPTQLGFASGVLSQKFYTWLTEESIKTLRQTMEKIEV